MVNKSVQERQSLCELIGSSVSKIGWDRGSLEFVITSILSEPSASSEQSTVEQLTTIAWSSGTRASEVLDQENWQSVKIVARSF